MALILCIETSGTVCSVALFQDFETCIELLEDQNEFQHASVLTVLIEKILGNHKLRPSDITAVAISAGPGSYTGLRIGTSVAKGFCYALDIPLIAINSLEVLAIGATNSGAIPEHSLICPAIDARRMEVFTSLYTSDIQIVENQQAVIVDEASFGHVLDKGLVYFVGSGAKKIETTIIHPNLRYISEVHLSARSMGRTAFDKLEKKIFEDIAYFEPNYLKAFYTTAKTS